MTNKSLIVLTLIYGLIWAIIFPFLNWIIGVEPAIQEGVRDALHMTLGFGVAVFMFRRRIISGSDDAPGGSTDG